MKARKVPVGNAELSKLSVLPPEEVAVKMLPGSKPLSYRRVPLQYNYGTAERPVMDNLTLSIKGLMTGGGIRDYTGENNKVDHAINFRIDNERNADAVKFFDGLYEGLSAHLYSIKGKLGQGSAGSPEIIKSMFNRPIFNIRNKETGEIMPGTPLIFKAKLGKYDSDKTCFTLQNGKQVDWGMMYGARAMLDVDVVVKHVYIGAKMFSIVMSVVSGIITDWKKLGQGSSQTDEIEEWLQNPEAVENSSRIADAMAALAVGGAAEGGGAAGPPLASMGMGPPPPPASSGAIETMSGLAAALHRPPLTTPFDAILQHARN